jgi:hypothetical protein
MNRWKTGGVAALMVLALAIAGCDQQDSEPLDDALTSPSMDMTMPTDDAGTSPGMTDDAGTDTSPSASPSA